MRDLVLSEALTTMAGDCRAALPRADRGRQGDPLRGERAGRRLAALSSTSRRPPASSATTPPRCRELDSFGAACAALESADLAGPYLRGDGRHASPGEPRKRAELAGIVFLCRLWEELHRLLARGHASRIAAIDELEAGGEVDRGRDRGHRPAARPADADRSGSTSHSATIVRADTVDVPPRRGSARALGGCRLGARLPRRRPRRRRRPTATRPPTPAPAPLRPSGA